MLIVARDGSTHRLLEALLAQNCAVLGARTVSAALQVARRRRPHVVLLDDSFEELDLLMAGLTREADDFRAIVLAAPIRHGTKFSHLAVFGPVITKPFDHAQLRELVVNTASLCVAARESVRPETGARKASHDAPTAVRQKAPRSRSGST